MKINLILFSILLFSIVALVYGITYRIRQLTIKQTISVIQSPIDLFSDANLTKPLTYIDWGILYPDSSKTVLCYIKNNRDVTLNLTLCTKNWNPENASSFISITWNYTYLVINPSEVKGIEISIYVSPDVKKDTTFSNDIVINHVENS